MKATLKISLFTALLGLGLAGCSKEEAPTPTAPTAASVTANASGEAVLRAGERLTADQYLQSGDYRLIMQGDGNLVTYRLSDGSVRFNTQTQGNPGAFCTMQTDGNLVVYAADGRPLFNTRARTSPRNAHYALLDDDGGLFLVLSGYGIVAVQQGKTTVLQF